MISRKTCSKMEKIKSEKQTERSCQCQHIKCAGLQSEIITFEA